MTQDPLLNRLLALQPQMQLVAERMLGDASEAEDAVQETVVGLWQRRAEVGQMQNVEGYAMRSVRNYCISALQRRRPTVDAESISATISDDEARAEAALVEERASALDSMMARLPEAQRAAVRLKYIDCVDHAEMQRRLHMSSSNVYTTLSRAMSALKAMRYGR